ncbi:hypothetical protein [Halorussus sp. MSC15.2]|uniref:DUF7261 family protein n=1 Tax=Halorussus sp. MSC15.2 TaxID=2283638 RepID=UPI0013D09163|nr:hypothetical protein [Halorussus sp. MSC15.2]NEU56724.1 hypothetical protein [Halorussus sp. MSC15.2]
MADVRPKPNRESDDDGRRERGQLILVTGLAIAVMLVALVLLLNTVIYTQNLATRGAGIDDSGAVSYRQEVVSGVGGVVDAENREGYDSRAKVERNVTAAIGRFDDLTAGYRAERATVARVETDSVSFTDGTLLYQTNASRTLTSDGGSDDWTLAENVGEGGGPGVRHVTVTVSRENLSTSVSTAFAVRTRTASDEWRVHLYDDGSAVAVAVQNASESSPHRVCSTSGPEATVDLTAGTVNGTRCPALDWATGVSAPYDLAFENGTEATGTYGVTVAKPPSDGDVRSGNFAGPDAEESPRAVPAVYDAEFDVHFETSDLSFHTTVRVARGEPA